MRNKSFVWHAAFIISKMAEEEEAEEVASIAEIQSKANRENYERFIRIRIRGRSASEREREGRGICCCSFDALCELTFKWTRAALCRSLARRILDLLRPLEMFYGNGLLWGLQKTMWNIAVTYCNTTVKLNRKYFIQI